MPRRLLFIFLFQTTTLLAQGTRTASMDSLLQSYAFHGRFNGTVVVSTSDGMLYHRTISKQVKNSEEPVYGVMSLSKQYTAVAILKLAEQGKLRLDDYLIDYLPEYVPKKGRKITLHHLLSQSSGLIDNFARPTEDPDDVILPKAESIELDALLRKLYVDDVHSKPGKRFSYSNLNYTLLARVIEKVSHMPYAVYMEKEVFAPAKLTSTFSQKKNVPENLLAKPFQGQRNGAMIPASPYHESWLTGAGSIFTSATDLLKWTQVLENNLILSKKSEELLFGKHTAVGSNRSYGYGWMVEQREGKKFVWHDGTYEGYSSYLGWLPEVGLRIILLTNHTNQLEELDQTEDLIKELADKLVAIERGDKVLNLPISTASNTSTARTQHEYKLDSEHFFVLRGMDDSVSINTRDWSLFEYPYLLSVEGDDASLKKAKKFCSYFVDGKYGRAKRLGTFGIRLFPAALYKGFWKDKTRDAGAFVGFNVFKQKSYDESVTYSVRFNYEKKQFGLIVSVNAKNKVQGFFDHRIPEKGKYFLTQGVAVNNDQVFVDGFRYNTQDVSIKTQENGDVDFCVGDKCFKGVLMK